MSADYTDQAPKLSSHEWVPGVPPMNISSVYTPRIRGINLRNRQS